MVGAGTVRPSLVFTFSLFFFICFFYFCFFCRLFSFCLFFTLVLFLSFVGCCGVKHTAATVVEMCFLVVQRLYPKLIDYF